MKTVADIFEQSQYGNGCNCVEGRCRFVADKKLWRQKSGSGDKNPLTLTSGELVWVSDINVFGSVKYDHRQYRKNLCSAVSSVFVSWHSRISSRLCRLCKEGRAPSGPEKSLLYPEPSIMRRLLLFIVSRFSPAKLILPLIILALSGSNPAIAMAVLVLPLPELPISPNISPSRIPNSMFFTTGTDQFLTPGKSD